jgi:hypothetical protein
VVTISAWGFRDCSSLVSVHIPGSVTVIGSGAFRSCHLLEKVNIPEAATSIANDAFFGCTRFRQASAAEVRDEAFLGLDARRDARAREAAARLSEKMSLLRGDFARTKGGAATTPGSPSALSTRPPSTGDLRSQLATGELWTESASDLLSQGSVQLATGELWTDSTGDLQSQGSVQLASGELWTELEDLSKLSDDLAGTGSEDLGKLSNDQLRSQMLDTIQVIRRRTMERQRLQKLQATSSGTQ